MANFEATPISGSKSGLGEGTLWDERRKSFLWVVVLDGYIKEYLPKSKEVVAHKVGDFVSYVGKRKSGGYVVALGNRLATTDSNFFIVDEIDMHIDRKVGRTNDGNIDSSGSLWIGVAEAVEGSKAGDLRRIDHQFKSSTHRKNVQISNGIDWSLDGSTMYYRNGCFDNTSDHILRFENKSYGGQSGSGFYYKDVNGHRCNYAVVSHGNDSYTGCTRVTSPKFDCIQEVINANQNCPSTGIGEDDRNDPVHFEIYPNPAVDHINLGIEEGIQGVQVFIRDLMGNIVCSTTVINSREGIKLPVSNLPDGFYIVTLTSGKQSGSRKFIKASH